MTLTELQQAIHRIYTGDNTIPESTSAEWAVRTAYIDAAVNAWESEIGVFWNELWTMLSAASDGDKTVVAATLAYDCPSDFKFLGGYVKTGDTKWQIKKAEEADVQAGNSIAGLDDGYAYVTGNRKDGYKINFSSQPTVDDTIEYPYYRHATSPSGTSDKVEMSDPYFCVYFPLSNIYQNDGEGDRATFAMSQAESKLAAMKTLNAMAPHYQPNEIHDSTIIRTDTGFGI